MNQTQINHLTCEHPFKPTCGKLRLLNWRSAVLFFLGGFVLWYPPSLSQEVGQPFSVIAYLPEYRISTLQPNQLKCVTELIFFGVEPTADGILPDQPIQPETLTKLHQLQKKSGCPMLLSVGGWGRSQHFDALVSNVSARKRFIRSLKNLCLSHHFSGVDFDWEHPKGNKAMDAYAALLKETRTSFHAQGLKVTLALASWQDLGNKAYEAVDRVHLMSYDHNYPQATFEKSVADVKGLINNGCPPEKIALGIPFYGRDRDRQAMTYRELAANADLDPALNEIHGYAFNGRDTLTQKINYALRDKLQGIMIWEIGQDSFDATTSLLQRICSQVQSTKPLSPGK